MPESNINEKIVSFSDILQTPEEVLQIVTAL